MTTARQCKPNNAFLAARREAGLSQADLAAEVQAMGTRLFPDEEPKSITAIDRVIRRVETGVTRMPREQWYVAALCRVLKRGPEELFGKSDGTAQDTKFTVASHKFVPVYVGPDITQRVAAAPGASPVDHERLKAHTLAVPYRTGECVVTAFSFGVLLFHVVEQGPFTNIADLAVWRVLSEQECEKEVRELIRRRWPAAAAEVSHTFHAYWVTNHGWSDEQLGTAMRLLCHSSSLLRRRSTCHTADELLTGAEQSEEQRFREGFTEDQMQPVGMDGVSLGYVSWSGLSYLPLSESQAVRPEEMAAIETVVQALWCYTHAVLSQLEPDEVPDEYGSQFLRFCERNLTAPKPHANMQLRTMKKAIIDTSDIRDMLGQAVAALK